MHLEMSSAQWRLFRLGLNVLTRILAASPPSGINNPLSFTRKPFNSTNNVILRYTERLSSIYIYICIYYIFQKSVLTRGAEKQRGAAITKMIRKGNEPPDTKLLTNRIANPTYNRHYSDVTMIAMVSQITSLHILYSTVYSRRRSKEASKLCVTDLCEGNSPVTREIPTQMASNAENDPFVDVIMIQNHCHYTLLIATAFARDKT